MRKFHDVSEIKFAGSRMLMTVDGDRYSCDLSRISERLANAAQSERDRCEVSPAGYGIHWPLVDEDLSVDGLLREARLEAEDGRRDRSSRRSLAVAEGKVPYSGRQVRGGSKS